MTFKAMKPTVKSKIKIRYIVSHPVQYVRYVKSNVDQMSVIVIRSKLIDAVNLCSLIYLKIKFTVSSDSWKELYFSLRLPKIG